MHHLVSFLWSILLATRFTATVRAERDEVRVHNDRRMIRSAANESPPATVLFSMTTTLHNPGKENFVRTALDSFLLYHPNSSTAIKCWLLINEYDEQQPLKTMEALHRIQQRYPFIETYQKTAHEQGQARSLNIILESLRMGDVSYWLHIEESWRTVRPFLDETLNFLHVHPYLHQLQLYNAAYYLDHTHTRVTEDVKVVALNSHVDLRNANVQNWRSYSYRWPSYSLRPSLTQAKFLRDHPELTFNTSPGSFPVIFELEFAIRWQLLGGAMCTLLKEAIVRQEGHQSTYTLTS